MNSSAFPDARDDSGDDVGSRGLMFALLLSSSLSLLPRFTPCAACVTDARRCSDEELMMAWLSSTEGQLFFSPLLLILLLYVQTKGTSNSRDDPK